MTDFKAWIPPAGEVVDAPVHVKTSVRCMYSDGSFDYVSRPAGDLNWSAEGDGPCVVAYAVIEEYTPAPKVAREWWVAHGFTYATKDMAICAYRSRIHLSASTELAEGNIIHVREVLPGREVVAWAVVDHNGHAVYHDQEDAQERVDAYGGTVVRLSGVMPS